jgi:hypothetical protein
MAEKSEFFYQTTNLYLHPTKLWNEDYMGDGQDKTVSAQYDRELT